MKLIFYIFLIIHIILLYDGKAKGQTANCYYGLLDSLYSCHLDTRHTKYEEKLIGIDGEHEASQTDANVKMIENYQENNLKQFSSIFCQKFPNLEVIKINDADLLYIDYDSLSSCINLERLLLNANKIRDIPMYLLYRNPKLAFMEINKNQLTSLPEYFLFSQQNLEHLRLAGNQIKSLPNNIFKSLVKLEVLYLENNKLHFLNPEWFVNLQNLKILDLHGNQILEVPSKCFVTLRNLAVLWLFDNKINDLKSDSFEGLKHLQLMSLNSNEISNLPDAVFAQLIIIKKLFLRNNKLTIIRSESFGTNSWLTDVLLDNNKINAIDEKFIDNTAVSSLNMTNNICSQVNIAARSEIKQNLQKCFMNYQPREVYPKQSSSCGRSVVGQGSIIGGRHITRGSFPWIATLITTKGDYFCGGTLISRRKVLTASHCIQEKHTYVQTLASEFSVTLGAHDLKMPFEVDRMTYAVQKVNVHPDWNPQTSRYDADITVIILEREVIFNEYIQPICMPNLHLDGITSGLVVGYGKSEDEGKMHENIPKVLEIPIHSNEDCFLRNNILATFSSKRTFCGGTGTGVGVCKGDSGSGLFVTDGSANYLLGIVSSSVIGGRYGCDVDTYSVFTDVTKYIDWINRVPTSQFK